MRTSTSFVGRAGLFVFGILIVALGRAQTVSVGESFPDFTEKDFLTNESLSLENLRGDVVVIDFWATWCGPCRRELPIYKKIYEVYGARGVEIVSISLDRDLEQLKRFIARERLGWHHIADGKGWSTPLAKKLKVNSIPRAYVLDRAGRVVANKARGERLIEAIGQALARPWNETFSDAVEQRAAEELRQADALRQGGRHQEALKAYDQIVSNYFGRRAAKIAHERACNLRRVLQTLEGGQNGREKPVVDDHGMGASWLQMARSMADAKNYPMARRWYRRIMDTYPGSQEAKTAQKEMSALPL